MKKISRALKAVVDRARAGESYWIEAAKLHFAVALDRRRRAAGLSYRNVAEKLGTSAAYVSKVFRGDANVTIETMVKLAHATGGRLELNVVDAQAAEFSWAVEDCLQALENWPGHSVGQVQVARASSTIIDFPSANHEFFSVAA